jgi:hypothetical protein
MSWCTFSLHVAVGLVLSLMMQGAAMAVDLPKEPGDEFLVYEDVNIMTGLYTREYSLKQDGIVDFKTARQILISEYNTYWNSVIQTEEWPLFYWIDENQDGVFDHFVDQQVRGNPEEIIPYLPVGSHGS